MSKPFGCPSVAEEGVVMPRCFAMQELSLNAGKITTGTLEINV